MKLGYGKIFIVSVILFFIIGYIGFPVYSILIESLKTPDGHWFSGYTKIFEGNVFLSLQNSMVLSVITIIGSLLIGLILACTLFFLKIPFKNIYAALFLVPIATPPIVSVTAFAYLLGDYGLLSKLLTKLMGSTIAFSFDGWSAILLIHLFSFYPFFFLFISNALKKLDPDILDASRVLGAGRIKTFFSIVIPHLSTSVISASIIVFMASMASFSAPFIFGGSERFVTTEIYSAKINNDYNLAAVLSVLLTFISILFLAGVRYFDKQDKNYASKGATKIYSIKETSKTSYSGSIVCIVTSIVIVLPVAALAYLSFLPEGSLMRDTFSDSLTLENYVNMFSQSDLFTPFKNSLLMSIVAVGLSLLIGISVSFLVIREKIFGARVLEISSSLPYAIPATVIAIAFILSFNTPSLFTGYTVLVGTFWILPIAYAVRNIPIVTQSTISGLKLINPDLESASRSLGAGKLKSFFSITVPLLLPTIINASLLVFIASIGEFVATILLYTYDTKTISVEIYSQMRMYNTGVGAAYGMILFLTVMIVVYFSRRTIERGVRV